MLVLLQVSALNRKCRKKPITAMLVRLFTSAVGGSHPFTFWFICFGSLALTKFGNAFQIWFLGIQFSVKHFLYD
jgi:hypothetical protein